MFVRNPSPCTGTRWHRTPGAGSRPQGGPGIPHNRTLYVERLLPCHAHFSQKQEPIAVRAPTRRHPSRRSFTRCCSVWLGGVASESGATRKTFRSKTAISPWGFPLPGRKSRFQACNRNFQFPPWKLKSRPEKESRLRGRVGDGRSRVSHCF